MAELTANAGLQTQSRSFFIWMAGLCVFFAFGGFSTTYFIPMTSGSLREVTPSVHIHGMLFFSWTLMFLLQSSLIASGKVVRHRALGLAGISLATAMVIFGLIVNMQFTVARLDAGISVERTYSLAFGGTTSMIGFATLFGFAIANVKRPDVHKRLMLFATCMILSAAVSRLWSPLFEDLASVPVLLSYATIDIIIVACVLHDRRSLGRIHGATIAGGLVIVGAQILRMTIPGTDLWQNTAPVMLRLLG